ncbi:uncharacterized protein LOC131668843 [Phymastichus coffea]|uniref:uncharacterized protein LOC131668843 n=1 Tax=Phymastichus coffea TaxID=108790 RepID=UPI00273C1F2E|nr:uncharacterized protein LOC131668843 [Phymastichus coffea]XP_058799288.1 uncharacterized protein LOC131668843 [Phymastichus coffea]
MAHFGDSIINEKKPLEFVQVLPHIKPVAPILIKTWPTEMNHRNEIINASLNILTNSPRCIREMRLYLSILGDALRKFRYKQKKGFYREMTTSKELQELEISLALLFNEMNVAFYLKKLFGNNGEKKPDDYELESVIDEAVNEAKRWRTQYLDKIRIETITAPQASTNSQNKVASGKKSDCDVNSEDVLYEQIFAIKKLLKTIKPVPPILLETFPKEMRYYDDNLNVLKDMSEKLQDHLPYKNARRYLLIRLEMCQTNISDTLTKIEKVYPKEVEALANEFPHFKLSHDVLLEEVSKILTKIPE